MALPLASDHAEQRVRGRIGCGEDPELLLAALWNVGRLPVQSDWAVFRLFIEPGFEYRVAIYQSKKYLLVKAHMPTRFVTVIKGAIEE